MNQQNLERKSEDASWGVRWKEATKRWAKEVSIGYLANPAAKRDFRVQFRGNRNLWVFSTLIISFSVITVYLVRQASTGIEPAGIQDSLRMYCMEILDTLALAVTLIAPVLAASAILQEKQRKSLDLIFVTPTDPKVFLFGKLISSFRYTWVLMALSLPFTAISLMAGGGTWINIAECYLLLSVQGLLFTAIGIYFASLVEKTLAALLYTYATVSALIMLAAAPVLTSSPTLRTPFEGGHLPFSSSLVPFLNPFASGTFSNILGVELPNTLLALILSIGSVGVLIRASASLLCPSVQQERRILRLVAVALISAFAGALATWPEQRSNIIDGATLPVTPANGSSLLLSLLPLIAFVPFLACYGHDAERTHAHGGLFKIKDIWGRSVAGGLPYIMLLVTGGVIGHVIGNLAAGKLFTPEYFAYPAYAFGFWAFMWSAARYSSSFMQGLRLARTLQVMAVAAVIGAPLPIFLLPSISERFMGFNMVAPFMYSHMPLSAGIFGLVFATSAALAACWSEKNYRKHDAARVAAKAQKQAAEDTLANLDLLPGLIPSESKVQHISL